MDLGYTFTYFFRGNFLEKNPYGITNSLFMRTWAPIMAYAPFWWRMWQCWNRFYRLGDYIQLANGFKYLTKLGPLIAWQLGCAKKIDGDTSFWGFFTAQLITTVYCIYWDYRWDWGLFIGTKKSTRFLRD